MRFLAIERELPGPSPKQMEPWLRAEAEAVWQLQQREVIREIWFAMPGRRAVLLLECADEADARSMLGTLPLVREACIAFDLLTLQPYDGFRRLFGPTP